MKELDKKKKLAKDELYQPIQEEVTLEDGSEVYFLARLRDRIVMQEYSVLLHEDEKSSQKDK